MRKLNKPRPDNEKSLYLIFLMFYYFCKSEMCLFFEKKSDIVYNNT